MTDDFFVNAGFHKFMCSSARIRVQFLVLPDATEDSNVSGDDYGTGEGLRSQLCIVVRSPQAT
jgi:hypothetical protein